ncbi:MAG TPA: tetratricopeptide repeat protein [Fredinandcohnia sp.]|nr:tetratricopeptide repeat protein [Fredinandcohnia sp.]
MDKNKIFQTATRLEQKGQIDRAIAEYERLVQIDPNEVRALLRIGSLYQKKGEDEAAARALEKAAESYANQGFFLKAVAVYKQVLKLAPTAEAHQRLAELYQQLGLLRDAMSQLQLVVATYEREGRTAETTAVLRKMLDLDPENALGRARLGELLLAQGDETEGRRQLELSLQQLEKSGRSDEFLRVAERLLQGDAPDPALARKVAKIHLDEGEARKALARLQIAFKVEPSSIETLTLLARGFQELGDSRKAASVYKEMARLHREAGRAREEREAWKQVLRFAPDDPAAREALSATAPAAAPTAAARKPTPPPMPTPTPATPAEPVPVPDARRTPPSPPPAAQANVPQPEPSQPPPARPEDVPRLLAEFDVYFKYKLYPKAQGHLSSLLAVAPDSIDVQERAARLAEATGDREAMRKGLFEVVRLARKAHDEERASKAIEKLRAKFPGDAEVEALGGAAEMESVSGLILVDEAPGAADEVVMAVRLDEDQLDDEPLVPPADEPGEVSAIPVEEDSALQAALELSALDVEAEETFHEPLLDIDVSVEPKPAADEPVADVPLEALPVEAKPPPAAPAKEPKEGPVEARAEAKEDSSLDAEIDEARFYLSQEMWDEAEELLRDLHARAPNEPRVRHLQEKLRSLRAPAAPPPAADAPAPTPVHPPRPEPARAAKADEVDRAEKRKPSSAPERPTFAKALTVQPAEEGTFDLAEELLGDLGLEEEAPAAAAPADFQYSVEEVLEEFKKGISQVVSPEDSETHYNLGIAYKEMGLFAEAIGAFQQAIEGCRGTRREVDCLTTAGLCHLELGQPEEAIRWFKAGLGAAGVTADAAIALHYEIGSAYEGLGKREEALEYFTKVHRADPNYREVASALERLQDGGAGPANSPVNKGKVGYV